MRKLASVVFLAFAFVNANAQDRWITVAESYESVFAIQPGSLEETRTIGGLEIAAVVGRSLDKKTRRIELRKWYVTLQDCSRKLGKLVTLRLDGTYFFDNDFVFGSETIASQVAEIICGAHNSRTEPVEQWGTQL